MTVTLPLTCALCGAEAHAPITDGMPKLPRGWRVAVTIPSQPIVCRTACEQAFGRWFGARHAS